MKKRSALFSARTGGTVRTALSGSGLVLLAALAGSVAGCSSSPPLFLSDGRPTTLVQCPEGSDSCVQQARAACGGTQFDTVRQSTENGTLSLIYACPTK